MTRDTPLPVVGCPTPSPDPSMGFRISLCLDSRVARMQMSSIRVSTEEGQREPELEKYDSNQRLKLRSEGWLQPQNEMWCLQVSGVNLSSESHWICRWLSVESLVSHKSYDHTLRMSSNLLSIPPVPENLPSLEHLSNLPLLTSLLLFPDLAWLSLLFIILCAVVH